MHYVNSKGILSSNNGMNIYRGCSHGCIYCDSRSKCYAFEHPFEDIEVKKNAPQLLEAALKAKRKRCMIGTGSMCDPYLPAEETLRLTRSCLEIIDRYAFGAAVLTKSKLILRDLDVLRSINRKSKCVVQMTLTTYDETLCRVIEPNVCTTRERFEVLLRMRDAGIPTVVWLTPILPFINDTRENIDGLLDYCVRAGVRGIVQFGTGLTLREGSREYFYAKLDEHFPGKKQQYMVAYGNAYVLPSSNEAELVRRISETCRKHGILYGTDECFAYLNAFPEDDGQMTLF